MLSRFCHGHGSVDHCRAALSEQSHHGVDNASPGWIAQPWYAAQQFLAGFTHRGSFHPPGLGSFRFPVLHIQFQRHLRTRRGSIALFPWPCRKTIFLAYARHPLCSLAPVFFRRITIFRVPLVILFRQPRKLSSHKWQKLFCRRWHQKQRTRKKPLRARRPAPLRPLPPDRLRDQ